MAQDTSQPTGSNLSNKQPVDNHDESFPWHLGVYDAHCHPTDTMSSIASIPDMKTRVLTVMATRAQDQELVTLVADTHSINSTNPSEWQREECILPCFGWHPWFAHQMYISDDSAGINDEKAKASNNETSLTGEEKIEYYQKALHPHRDNPTEEDRNIFLSLPDPQPFSRFLIQTRQHLQQYPFALIGEVGLDRSFRIPEAWIPEFESNRNDSLTPGGREGRRLTPFRCDPTHQKRIFRLQLELAAEYGRAVSVHGVQAHGLVFDVLKDLWKGHERKVLSKREKKKKKKQEQEQSTVEAEANNDEAEEDMEPKPYPPRICLHSYSGNPSNFKQYLSHEIPTQVFASFSTAINLGDEVDEATPRKVEEMIKAVPDHMLLVESDLHTAGSEMDSRMEDIVRRVCRIKGWGLEEGVKALGDNWRRFAFG